ncbi:acyltransferase family protein [Sphingomonas sp. QA11]|uniref:acyltransferase family protein n=1 Tax=Sphingomonas sp. QA11 TaxID=2950605 RepID=UPI00234B755A|nr:acyltransferase [Sphingomonas sp. QA11]WCM26058.1 acyltransferase family protein [Sphingomonas sp. QA11]
MERHYGMDWLRIGAFGLLIFYHVGMVFVTWGFHVKTADPAEWVAVPMLLTNAWRLTLLFVVSGFASRALFAKSTGIRGFLGNRNARLLLPLAFGVVAIVPPQSWVELVTQHGYAHSFPWFLAHDYFRFGTLDGVILPTWNHLWFVAYLWVYTLALAPLLAPRLPGVQAMFDRLFGGPGVLWIPLAWLLLIRMALFPNVDETHDLVTDGVAHLQYFLALLFGFGLAGSRPARAALARFWVPAAVLAVASYAIVASVAIAYPGFAIPTRAIARTFHVAREVQCWASIAALIGIAERFWNRDHAWRPMLTEAVFPFYIIHQTVIVVVEYWLKPLDIGPVAEFAILVPATVAGCWAFYLIGRRIGWLRPLIGLRRKAAAKREAVAAAPQAA